MSKQMTISEILWKAANEHLSTHLNALRFSLENTSPYSCDAAGYGTTGEWQPNEAVLSFLRELGCPGGCEAFSEFEAEWIEPTKWWERITEESQGGARYSWLMFASMIAEEWGL